MRLGRVQTAILLALAAATLAGCGVRGSLQPPPGAASAPPEASATSDQPARPSVLDRIIR